MGGGVVLEECYGISHPNPRLHLVPDRFFLCDPEQTQARFFPRFLDPNSQPNNQKTAQRQVSEATINSWGGGAGLAW